VFPNFWQGECSGDARRRAWKRSGLRRTLNATVSKVDNLVWLPSARKRENWSRGPTVDDFCAGTHGCPPKIGDPRLTHRGPRVDLRPCNCVVTVSSTGAENQFQGDDNGHASLLGFPCSSLSGTLVSYGASAVTRTSDRGHVAEARNQGHRSGGVPIRVSKEILLPLNVHWCSVSSTKMLKTVH